MITLREDKDKHILYVLEDSVELKPHYTIEVIRDLTNPELRDYLIEGVLRKEIRPDIFDETLEALHLFNRGITKVPVEYNDYKSFVLVKDNKIWAIDCLLYNAVPGAIDYLNEHFHPGPFKEQLDVMFDFIYETYGLLKEDKV